MVSSLVTFAAVLACVPQAVAVAVEAQHRIVRRQNEEEVESESTVQLGSAGEILRSKIGRVEGAQTHQDAAGLASGIPADPGEGPGFCNSDFVKGVEKQDGCGDHPFPTTKVDSKAMCLAAARRAHAAIHISEVEEHLAITDIPEIEHDTRPGACYLDECPTGPGLCHFWNHKQGPSNIEKGTPVCRRAYYEAGTATPGDITNGCPEGYEVIDIEVGKRACEDARICKDLIKGGQNSWLISPITQQWFYPLGCFFLPGDDGQDIAYFNPGANPKLYPSANQGLATEGPHDPVRGTPICQVKQPYTVHR